MKKTLLAIATLSILLTCCKTDKATTNKAPYLNPDAPIEERVEDALARMTLREKINIIHAQSKFSAPGVPRLGIAELWTTDGPHGVRPEVKWDEWDQAGWTNDSCTAYPALTCLAATWNRDMAKTYGVAIGEEARFREKDVLLGPGVNIYRTPLGGRNFEYMGEDPYLAAQMVVPYVKGVQEQGVATCVKHYALNNEETHRHTVDVDCSDRALYEIYLPAFKAAVVEGGTWSIMGSYNKYRGTHACHNDRLLNKILKEEWGFDGAVVSDWGGAHNTDEAITNGLDLEFGTWVSRKGGGNSYDRYYMAQPYLERIQKGEVGTAELDEKVRRVLRLTFRTAMNPNKPYGALGSESHIAAARAIGGEGVVLLKNDNNNLPISAQAKNILVVGENAIKVLTIGGGSSSLKARHECVFLEGMMAHYEGKAEIAYARGYVGDVGRSYNGVSGGRDLNESRSAKELIAEAVDMARTADAVVFVGGLNKSDYQDCEGTDRKEFALPYGQGEVIEALAEATDHLTVVLLSGNAVEMPWVDRVESVVQGWFLGSETGNVLAAVLSGEVNPSGKLPFTFGKKLEDYPSHAGGATFPNDGPTTYHEDIFVGYRGFEKAGVEPLFAFGHGLSYTTFEYSNLTLSSKKMSKGGELKVSVKVRNNGECKGKEVVQLYVSDLASSLPRPVKELKEFAKVELEPGESRTVNFTLDKSALSYYDDVQGCWVAESGDFEVLVGSSSADIRQRATFTLK